MASTVKYTFGPFELDDRARQLVKLKEPVRLSDRQLEVLLALVSRAGQVVSKDDLIQAAWRDVAVGDNSLEQVISQLRRALGVDADGRSYIETLARRGYRFDVPVERTAARRSDASIDALMGPHVAFVEGRAALETLGRDAVARARGVFEDVVRLAPDSAPGHLGLANALALTFESTRADAAPDTEALRGAAVHARDACRLDAASGEAWATLAFVLSRAGVQADAIAAGRRAVSLEPDNWRHAVRLAYASWGEERLGAAHRALRVLPGVGLAHWLAATVYVARQAFDAAERELADAAAAQSDDLRGGRFGAVGLHLLSGLICLARDDEAGAVEAFERELALEDAGHIHSRQACANTWCALGSVRLRHERQADAVAAFRRAADLVPGHAGAVAMLAAVAEGADRSVASRQLTLRLEALRTSGAVVEAAMIGSVPAVLAGRHEDAAAAVHKALLAAPAGSSGWTLPVEPILQVGRHSAAWAAALTVLRGRAA